MTQTVETTADSTVGRLVVDKGLATPEEVDQARQRLRAQAGGSSEGSSSSSRPAAETSHVDSQAATNGTSEAGKVVIDSTHDAPRGAPSKTAAAESSGPRAANDSSGSGANPSQRTLGQTLVDSGVITARQLDRLKPELETQRASQQLPGYQILDKLGAGAMASVYKARQVSLDRTVAVKVLPQKYTKDKNWVRRFYDEGKAAAKLNHANIVQAIDVGQSGEFHYFVMEYVEGKTVYDDIAKRGRYPESEALSIIIQTARALKHAHDAGFIHRDVKPKNIMITPEATAKLADMGLARAISDREAAEAEAGKAYGTPYYISPEQIRGDVDVDFRADIYALGATAYHMVTGKVPFEAPNPSSVMHKHLKEELVPPDHINAELSAGLGEVIELCMAKNRDKRYHSTADLLEDLELVSRGEPPQQARRAFDVSSLSALEASSGEPVEDESTDTATALPLTAQPVFWAAVAGWAFGLVMLIITLLLALS